MIKAFIFAVKAVIAALKALISALAAGGWVVVLVINLPTTSVEQAKYCADNGYGIGQAELQPGDLVF